MKTQICWVCRDTTKYELEYVSKSDLYYGARHKELELLRTFKALFAAINERDHMLKDWIDICERASSKILSVPSDRLPSLSGLASLLQPSLQTRYVAGHWESNLIPSLVWACDRRAESRPYTGYIAPSWSWASASRPVQHGFVYPLDPGLAQVVEVDTTPAGTDKFGALKDGYLRLRGPALGQITSIDDVGTSFLGYPTSLLGFTKLPEGVSVRFEIRPDDEELFSLGPNQERVRSAVPPGFRLSSLCWLVLSRDEGIFGLMLERVENRSDGAFRRVGMFRQYDVRYPPEETRDLIISNLPIEEYLIV